MNNNVKFMSKALMEAKKAFFCDEVPVGAVLIYKGEVIAASGNRVRSGCDPTAHAEIVVIREACRMLGTLYLTQCTLYSTLEPCPMCAQAIAHARIPYLYFGAYDVKGGGVEHGPRIFSQTTCHHQIEVYGGIMETDCGAILKNFFRMQRRSLVQDES